MPPIHIPKRQAPAPGRWWSLQHVRPYVLAVFFVAVATLARWLLRPLVGNELPFITYFGAVFVSAWRLGWRPTVLTVSLSALLAAVLFLPPVAGGGASGLLSLIGLALFIAIGLGTGIVGESRLQALRRAHEHTAEALRLQEAALAQVQSVQTQLLHAQQLDAIGQLAGGVAHDFNNILTAIAGYCGFLLADTPAGDRRRDDIVGIKEAADRAAALTQQLLAFGRKQMMQPAILDVRKVIADAGQLLRRLIAEDIELIITTGPILSSVLADRGQLGQVLVNLAVNARDAMPAGGRLVIEARDELLGEAYAETHLAIEPGPYVRIAVSDTGHGMTPEVKARIFEPFFTTKPAGKGTGLGLSTVYGIVKQFGGHVLAYSEPGHGTTVKVYLPRAEGVAATTTREESPPLRAGLETVLVVEDDAVIRKVARRVLEMQSYTVLMASTPTEALEVAAQFEGHIDLLLTDVILPGVTGPRLAELLLLGRPGLPVLYMSGYADDAIVHSGQLAPDTEFLSKPFTPETLLRRVRQTLDQHGAAGAAASA